MDNHLWKDSHARRSVEKKATVMFCRFKVAAHLVARQRSTTSLHIANQRVNETNNEARES